MVRAYAVSRCSLTAYARTMVSLLERWHLDRRAEVIENLCHALDRAILDAKDRYALHTMALRKLDKASSSHRRSQIYVSQSETQEQRAQRMKSVLLGAMQQSKEARATAGLLRASEMTGPDDAVYVMGLFRTASAVLLHLAED